MVCSHTFIFYLHFLLLKKTDVSSDSSGKQRYAAKFFEKPAGSPAELQAIIDLLKSENDKTGFVSTLPENAGLPVWGKLIAEKPKPKPGFAARGIITDEKGNMLIPLSNDNKTLSALLFAMKKDGKYEFYYYDNNYAYWVAFNNDKYSVKEREMVTGLFMGMSNYVFGIKEFKSIPKDLFPSFTSMPEENGITKKVFLMLGPGTLPDIFISGYYVNTSIIEKCIWVFTGTCSCHSGCTSPSCCDHPNDEWPQNVCTRQQCYTLIIQEEDGPGTEPPSSNPNNGTGVPVAFSSSNWSSGLYGGGTLPDVSNGNLPNATCSNCAWYAKAAEYEFEQEINVTNPEEAVSKLGSILNLNQEQLTWLNSNSITAMDIYDALEESLADENPETNLPYQNVYPQYATAASKMTIDVAMNNLISRSYDENHFQIVSAYLPQNNSVSSPIYWLYFSINCAIIKLEHPEYSETRVYWEASKEMIHLMLDGAGLIPVVGEIADLTNGIIYTLEGDGVNATLSFAATIPIAGWAATTAKFAKRSLIALDGSKRTLYLMKKMVNGVEKITFGDRGLLRKVLGLAKGDARVAHHLIPWKHAFHDLVQKGAESGFHLNEILNGIPLTAAQHSGSHSVYNNIIAEKLEFLWQQFLGPSGQLNAMDAEIILNNLANDIRAWIVAHPNESINNIVLP